jgi:formylmethanofuran dehydrogenase subunit E
MVTRFDEMGLLLSDLPTEMGDRMLAALVTGKTVLIVASFKGGRAVRMYASETPAHSALTDTLAAVANRTKK